MNRPHEELPELTEAEAIKLLNIHAGSCEDDEEKRMLSGFMFSLYSWNDKLNPENFRQVMACIKSLGPSWSTGMIPSRVMSDLWQIIYLGRCYVHDPRRIKQREQYILAPDELGVEEEWLDCIGWAVMAYLEFDDAQVAFARYDEHVTKQMERKH